MTKPTRQFKVITILKFETKNASSRSTRFEFIFIRFTFRNNKGTMLL